MVTALVIVGAALRVFRLGNQSLWVDEIMTLRAADAGQSLSLRQMFLNIQGPLHGTLINLVSGASMSEVALRTPSVIASVATIPIVYLLGKELAGHRAGITAAAFAAVSPFAIWYSQEVRNYSLLMFFAAVATLLIWRLIERSGRGWSAYALVVALALYSNLSAAFLAAAHGLFGLGRVLRDRRFLGRWVLTYVCIVLLFMPMVAGLARWFELDDVSERVHPVHTAEEEDLLRGATTFTPLAIPYAVFNMVYGYSLGPSLRELHVRPPLEAYLDHLWTVVPAGVAAVLIALLGLRKLSERPRVLFLVLSVILVPLASAGLLAFLNVKPFNVRYVAVMYPVLCVVLGAGVASSGKRTAFVLGGVVGAFLLLSLGNYHFDPEYWREDVRAAAVQVAAREAPGDIVLVPVVKDVFDFYYDGPAELVALYPAQTGSSDEIAARLDAMVEGHTRLWFVDSRLWFADPDRRIPEYLGGSYGLIEDVDFPGVRVSLYRLQTGP